MYRFCRFVCGGQSYATFTIGKTEAKTIIGDDAAAAASHQAIAIVEFGIKPAFAGTGG